MRVEAGEAAPKSVKVSLVIRGYNGEVDGRMVMHIDGIERALKDAVDRGVLDAAEVDEVVTRQRVADADLTEATNEQESSSKNARVADALDEYNHANAEVARLVRKSS